MKIKYKLFEIGDKVIFNDEIFKISYLFKSYKFYPRIGLVVTNETSIYYYDHNQNINLDEANRSNVAIYENKI